MGIFKGHVLVFLHGLKAWVCHCANPYKKESGTASTGGIKSLPTVPRGVPVAQLEFPGKMTLF
jgi:hypothetical protein